jgi:hypothetical protein
MEPMGVSNMKAILMHHQFQFIIKKQQYHHLHCDEKARNKYIYNIKYMCPFPVPLTKMKSGSCKIYMNVKRKDFALVVRFLLVVALVNENTINISM